MHAKTPPQLLVPPLVNGDHLSREEFERRYEAMPNVEKAELIEGVVYMPSPVRWDYHGEPHATLVWLCRQYRASSPGVRTADNATVRLDEENEPQPDISLMVGPDGGGQSRVGEDGYLEGAPELVVEVAASTASIDLHKKFGAYSRNGVREYIVWRTEDGELDWFAREGDDFRRLLPDAEGLLRSRAFPGLWIDVPALLRDDDPALLASLSRGLASPEHAAFVRQLRDATTRAPTE